MGIEGEEKEKETGGEGRSRRRTVRQKEGRRNRRGEITERRKRKQREVDGRGGKEQGIERSGVKDEVEGNSRIRRKGSKRRRGR